ncbi:hypothetical protein GCM10029964_015460 [Kibdelosporangium lantanae]
MHTYPTHQSVVAFDVEGFSDPYRDNNAMSAVRTGIYRLVQGSFAAAGVPWESCVHEDRGMAPSSSFRRTSPRCCCSTRC